VEGEQEEVEDEDEEPLSHHVAAAKAAAASASYSGQLRFMNNPLAQQLPQPGPAAGGEPLPRVESVWDSPALELGNRGDLYLQPSTSNNASWDAYYAHGEQRYILQYTVSPTSSLGVEQAPLVRLLKRLRLDPGAWVRGEAHELIAAGTGMHCTWAIHKSKKTENNQQDT
jgi:hypothetical protein